MSTDPFATARYQTLLDDLRAAPSGRLKCSVVELFAHKVQLDKGFVVDHLLANESGIFDRETIALLLSDSSPPPRPTQETYKPQQRSPLGAQDVAATGVSRATASDVQTRQRDLLQGYGKAATAAELSSLRGAPDPFDAPEAKAAIAGGGAPLEELRRKRKLWEQANKPEPALPPSKDLKAGRHMLPPPARLQLMAWLVPEQKSDGSLEVSAFAETSEKLKDDDDVYDAVFKILDKAAYASSDKPLDMSDLVMLDAQDFRAKLWSSNDISAVANCLFEVGATKREVYLAPLSKRCDALKTIKLHAGFSPKGKLGGTSYPVKRECGDDGVGNGKLKRAKHANNLYLQARKAAADNPDEKLDTVEVIAEWEAMGKARQARWLLERGLLEQLSEAKHSEYLKALGEARMAEAAPSKELAAAELMNLSTSPATREVRTTCGSDGCQLPWGHAGLCAVPVPEGRRRRG